MSKEEKQQALEELNVREAEHVKHGPLAQNATQPVPGEGNPNADILFIGEGPGKKEDELGRPFVGAAGKFLNELIESIGLKREDVFIANVVKHRPPGNRDPLPDEVELYKPWLEGQIEIIQPKLIVTLGRHSMGWLLGPGLSITAIHGQPKRRDGKVVMPMYHPAAALYRGDLRPVLKADFAKIPKVIELIDKEEIASTQTEEEAAAEKQAALL
ncbi:MAG: uracil-DNA glycosylase [Candidatus Andersenbacteria bacterium]